MPEYRRDALSQRWIIMAGDRAKRPSSFTNRKPSDNSGHCPFCPGHESETPKEVYALRAAGDKPDSPGWRVRVVPNKYPAVVPEIDSSRTNLPDGLFERRDAIGRHEVIILSPDHNAGLAELTHEQLSDVLTVCGQRLKSHRLDSQLKHAMLFYNHGPVSGASLAHPHFQLLASSVIPKRIADELKFVETHKGKTGQHVLREMIDAELKDQTRIVRDSNEFTVFCPYASRFPFETWIVPKSSQDPVELFASDSVSAMAKVIQDMVHRLDAVLDHPSFNLMFIMPPWGQPEYHHWRIELIPRITTTAGFELGSGCYINPVLPEFATGELQSPV